MAEHFGFFRLLEFDMEDYLVSPVFFFFIVVYNIFQDIFSDDSGGNILI